MSALRLFYSPFRSKFLRCRALSQEQINYAAIDAYACVLLYGHLLVHDQIDLDEPGIPTESKPDNDMAIREKMKAILNNVSGIIWLWLVHGSGLLEPIMINPPPPPPKVHLVATQIHSTESRTGR